MEKGGVKILISILVILIIVAGGVIGYKIMQDKQQTTEVGNEPEENNVLVAEVKQKKVQIYQGDDRPIAVMIDNHNQAWPQ